MSKGKIASLRKRDGDYCAICRQLIDFSLAGSHHPMAPSADHVLPRSRGGPGVMRNLRLAHASCNGRRGNGPAATWDVVMEALEYFAGKPQARC
jgi:5-methylcytosine-specific restriction endonuclease McrA